MIAILVIITGWASGALLNYLADILPLQRRSFAPVCVKCGKPMSWKNYFIWPRQCASCHSLRPWRTWIVELVALVGVVLLWFEPPAHLGFIAGLALLLYFGLIVIIDIEHRLILHTLSIAGGILGCGLGAWMHGFTETLLGGAIGFATMLVLAYAGKVILKLLTRRRAGTGEARDEALGFGDVILGGIVGLLLGYQVILTGLVVAVFIGSIYSFLYLILLVITRRYQRLSMIPYGPFLIASAVFILYFANAPALLAIR
jgi:prepilin signal peptidase PulO-like enzyme (type II secretory pathway)